MVPARNDWPPGSNAPPLPPTTHPPLWNTGTQAHGDPATVAHPHAHTAGCWPPRSSLPSPTLSRSQPALPAAVTSRKAFPLASCAALGRGGACRSPGRGGSRIAEPCSPAHLLLPSGRAQVPQTRPPTLPASLASPFTEVPANPGIGELNTCDSFHPLGRTGNTLPSRPPVGRAIIQHPGLRPSPRGKGEGADIRGQAERDPGACLGNSTPNY